MSRYIKWDDVVNRYRKISDFEGAVEVGSTYITYAEADIESKLSPKFSIPFASDNITAKDLCIDAVYMKAIMFSDPKKSKIVGDSIDKRVKALLDGSAQMILEDGEVLGQDVVSAWSETENYAPTFGAGDITDMQVSSARLYDEENARD